MMWADGQFQRGRESVVCVCGWMDYARWPPTTPLLLMEEVKRTQLKPARSDAEAKKSARAGEGGRKTGTRGNYSN